MPIYAYSARDTQGKLAEGALEVATEGELALRLEAEGMLLTTVRKVKSRSRTRRDRPRMKRRHLVTLTYNLETIYSSGIPLVEGLRDLGKHSENRVTGRIAGSLAEEIRKGSDLAGALDRYPSVFPVIYRSVVRAGESAGQPGPMLERLAEYYQWIGETKAMALRALTYPFVLMVAVCGLVMLLLTFLVPRVLERLLRTGAAMPLPTRILMTVSNFLKGNVLIILAALAAVVVGVFLFRRTTRGKVIIDKLKLRVPLAGTLAAKIAAARFASTVSMLYRAGIGTIDALHTAEHVVGNAFMAKGVREACEGVVEGRSLADALRSTGAFQPLVTRMIAVGEQTGTLGEALDRVNSFYDREIPQTIKNVLTILEPALIVGAGLAVGFILLCTFLPIFEMVRSIGR